MAEDCQGSEGQSSDLIPVRRFEFGLFGSDVKPVGEGLSELRVDVGKGYRVYFKRRGEELIIVFCGSQKKDQQKQIELARALYKEWRKANE
ncbi:type II toxin-antitoxin system RelE/ParE family toxin [Endozoicomonas sp.]|uniref:type II toxin-antitoxin system RelE/ParE family toxin n=1 Tax=Endozoicomonas sp. TaxID=1892382 RepID=UPI0028844141|nr:type II toxin-antitoxin system RelE/ParE family toxin [Endozoicomonas sp.]